MLGSFEIYPIETPKIVHFFLNILVCCKQQGVKRGRQNGVKKSRAECSLFGTPYGLTSLKSLMYNYKLKFYLILA